MLVMTSMIMTMIPFPAMTLPMKISMVPGVLVRWQLKWMVSVVLVLLITLKLEVRQCVGTG